jgi:glutathione S-transferase
MALPKTPLVLYDIAMRPPFAENCCSNNCWKARLALNFKALPYTTTWVPLPEVASTRRRLGVPACRKFADGSDFLTLPLLSDPDAGVLVGDSFDIAVHLQRTYPFAGAGNLFPPLPARVAGYRYGDVALPIPLTECRDADGFGDYAQFNVEVDAAFSANLGMAARGTPFDPAWEEEIKASWAKRAGVRSWDDFQLEGAAREAVKKGMEAMMGRLWKEVLTEGGKEGDGVFMLGETPCYADLIVGGWLRLLRATLGREEWEEVRGWQGGFWGRLHDALEVYAKVK